MTEINKHIFLFARIAQMQTSANRLPTYFRKWKLLFTMGNNNTNYSAIAKTIENALKQSVIQSAPLIELKINGGLSNNRQQPRWEVDYWEIYDKENYSSIYHHPELNTVNLFFDMKPWALPGINLAITTRIPDEYEPVIEVEEYDHRRFAKQGVMEEPPLDVLPFPEDDSETSYSSLDSDFSPAISETEGDLPIKLKKLDNKSVCIGDGLKLTTNKNKLPYGGAFLGIRLLYDVNRKTIIEVATDDGSKKNWYQADYKVIVYQTGFIDHPTLTVAICVWGVDLSILENSEHKIEPREIYDKSQINSIIQHGCMRCRQVTDGLYGVAFVWDTSFWHDGEFMGELEWCKDFRCKECAILAQNDTTHDYRFF